MSEKNINEENRSTSSKAAGAASNVAAEISGFTFIKRGLSANYRAVKGGGQHLKSTFQAFFKAQKNSAKTLVLIESLPLVERQVKQANSLLTVCICFFSIICGLIVFFSMKAGLIIGTLTSAFDGDFFTEGLSVVIGIMAVLYMALYGFSAWKDFRSLTAVTNAPTQLAQQYKSSFNIISVIFLIHTTVCIFLQHTGDVSILRTITGISVLLLTISLFNSARHIFNPVNAPIENNNILTASLKAILGMASHRSTEVSTDAHGSIAVILFISIPLTMINLLSKEASLIGFISLFATVMGLGVMSAMYIHGWLLEND